MSSTALVYLERRRRGAPAVSAPWRLLVVIGCLNGGGNWFQAVGQPHTPGLTQSLLTVLSVPLVLVLSFLFLKKRPSRVAAGAASAIVAGAAVSAFRGALNPGRGDVLIHFGDGDDDGGGIKVEYLSVALFAVAQVIFAGERVLEENVFAESLESLDAITMFCWTMWVQFFLYFPLLPSQRLAALGGLRPGQIAPVERDGVLCTFGMTATTPRGLDLPRCSAAGNAALFFAYVLVDGSCYCFGLYVIKVYSANAMVLAGSVALPLQQLVFCLPFLVGRRYAETLFGTDVLALALVLGGFLAYHRLAPENSQRRG